MINELSLNIITIIACVMTIISFLMTIVKSYLYYKGYKRKKDVLEKYTLELQKQLMELEKMKENIEFEEKESIDQEKYSDTKILIDNLIKQYKNIS